MSESHLVAGLPGFLFTDIEGSTRLWETVPEAMSVAQIEHDRIVSGAIRHHGGEIYRVAGDGMQAVFPSANDAVRAALESQRALAAQTWPVEEGLRVRMAIDSVRVGPSATGDYRSPQLAFLDWMMRAAHGEQILMSGRAVVASGTLPAGAEAIDLGEFGIPGMRIAEPVFQLTHPELRASFPTLRTASSGRGNARQPQKRLIGRRAELATLHRLVDTPGVRLVTLTGPGGIGKTRLAEQLALERQAEWGQTVWFVDLVDLSDPALVLAEIASTLGVIETGRSSPGEDVAEFLGNGTPLLILDNFEHLMPAARTVAELLRRVPGLQVMTTSRGPLRLRGERIVPIEPLEVPPGEIDAWDVLTAFDSVQLFVDRAHDFPVSFENDTRSARTLAGICRKLEGVPLAIELAAPRLRVLTLTELDIQLGQRLGLSADSAERSGRHRALRDSISWSYDLLPAGQQWFFRQLGVFQSGFHFEMLDGIFGTAIDTLGLVEALLESNLIHRGRRGDPDRFHLLESVRQFALEQLESHGELEAMQSRHARYFFALLLDRCSDQRAVDASIVASFAASMDDLRQAISWSTKNDPGEALVVAAVAWRLWYLRGQLWEGERWLAQVLDATGHLRTPERVRALNGRAILLATMARPDDALRSDRAGRMLAEQIGDDRGIGDACNHMVGVTFLNNQLVMSDEVRELAETAMAAYRRCNDAHGIAESKLNRSAMAYFDRRPADALRETLAVLDYCRAHGKDVLASNTLHGAVECANVLGQAELARTLLIEAFEINIRLGYDIFVSANASTLSGMLLAAGRPLESLRFAEFARQYAAEMAPGSDIGNPFGRVEQERAVIESMLTAAEIERAVTAGRRMQAPEAVARALAFLRDESLEG